MTTTTTRRIVQAQNLIAGQDILVPGSDRTWHVDHTDHIPGNADQVHVYLDGDDAPYPFGREVEVTVMADPDLPRDEDIINSWFSVRGDRTMQPTTLGHMLRGVAWAQQRTARDVAASFPGSYVVTLVHPLGHTGATTVMTYVVAGAGTPRH